MTSRLNPYLNFPGNAREALETYQRVFGGSLNMSTFGDFGTEDPDLAGKIMHGRLETERGFTLMASDMPPGMPHEPGNNMAVSVSGDDADDLRRYWDQLSDGATVSVPMAKQVWGEEFGACVDRFGVSWMVNITPPQV